MTFLHRFYSAWRLLCPRCRGTTGSLHDGRVVCLDCGHIFEEPTL